MTEFITLVPALAAGALLGAIFFGGLWWTVLKGISSENPALLFFASLLLRTSITLTGFYFVSQGDWRRLLACLLGFIIVRVVVTRLTRMPSEPKRVVAETSHAP